MIKSGLAANAELVEFVEMKQKLDQWFIPKDETYNLFHIVDLMPYFKKYKYVHIGLVQIALKPLTLLGTDTFLTLIIRDGRDTNWRKSLMGTVETSLSHDPVYFDIYPDLTVAMDEPNILNVLNVRILTKGYSFKPGSKYISLIYRIYFKVMTTYSPYVLKKSNKGETVLFESNLFATNVSIPRLIPWQNINFPESWVLENVVPPVPVDNPNIEEVIQQKDGKVYLTYNRPPRLLRSTSNKSIRTEPYEVQYPPTDSRNSIVSRYPSTYPPELEELDVRNIRLSNQQIPHGIYTPQPPVRTGPRTSPTPSEIGV